MGRILQNVVPRISLSGGRNSVAIATAVVFLWTLPLAECWWALGHMTVGEIALREVNSHTARVIDDLVYALTREYPDSKDFLSANCWPDYIKTDTWLAFDEWHYIDKPYVLDSEDPKVPPEARQNVVWAAQQAALTLSSGRSSLFEKAVNLRFFAHFIGDLHQPLHCTELFSRQFPDGDRGGNKYLLGLRSNLHSFWDGGAGLFEGRPPRPLDTGTRARVEGLAALITGRFPRDSFSDGEVMNRRYSEWAEEGHQIAIDVAYRTPEGREPEDTYVAAALRIVQKRVALAGYRLAFILDEIFERVELDDETRLRFDFSQAQLRGSRREAIQP